MKLIEIPKWMETEAVATVRMCELVNSVLQESPEMTLQEFANLMDKLNKQASYEWIKEAINKQFEGGRYETR